MQLFLDSVFKFDAYFYKSTYYMKADTFSNFADITMSMACWQMYHMKLNFSCWRHIHLSTLCFITQLFGNIYPCEPSIYTMDHPIFYYLGLEVRNPVFGGL